VPCSLSCPPARRSPAMVRLKNLFLLPVNACSAQNPPCGSKPGLCACVRGEGNGKICQNKNGGPDEGREFRVVGNVGSVVGWGGGRCGVGGGMPEC